MGFVAVNLPAYTSIGALRKSCRLPVLPLLLDSLAQTHLLGQFWSCRAAQKMKWNAGERLKV